MPKFQYTFGGDSANWDEHLYHRSFAVKNGVIEFEDEDDLAVDALLRRGWEQIEEPAEPVSPPIKTSRARSTAT